MNKIHNQKIDKMEKFINFVKSTNVKVEIKKLKCIDSYIIKFPNNPTSYIYELLDLFYPKNCFMFIEGYLIYHYPVSRSIALINWNSQSNYNWRKIWS